MKKYTLEDVEYIRSKAAVTYDEAINLMDAYEGDVLRVLAHLENQGKLKKEPIKEESPFWNGLKKGFHSCMEYRILVRKEEMVIVNISILFSLLFTIIAPHVIIIALIASLLLGYKIRLKKVHFPYQTVKSFVDDATQNVKKTVSSFYEKDGSDDIIIEKEDEN